MSSEPVLLEDDLDIDAVANEHFQSSYGYEYIIYTNTPPIRAGCFSYGHLSAPAVISLQILVLAHELLEQGLQ